METGSFQGEVEAVEAISSVARPLRLPVRELCTRNIVARWIIREQYGHHDKDGFGGCTDFSAMQIVDGSSYAVPYAP